jgi:hypothetical protein
MARVWSSIETATQIIFHEKMQSVGLNLNFKAVFQNELQIVVNYESEKIAEPKLECQQD